MSGVPFAKAHGLGNDFLLVRAGDLPPDPGAFVRRICHRHRGAGADGVIAWDAAEGVTMRLFNADGGEAEISGNGLRCLAAWVVRQGIAPPRHVVRTAAGPRAVEVTPGPLHHARVVTDLGAPVLASADIPMRIEPPRTPVVRHRLWAAGRELIVTATSLGNPHCAIFLDELPGDAMVAELGAAVERHAAFPRRTNVEFCVGAGVSDPPGLDLLRVRFWERGVGPTSASGTGAASAAVAAILEGRTGRRVRVVCDGGELDVEWPEGGTVRQTGDVELLYEGDWLEA